MSLLHESRGEGDLVFRISREGAGYCAEWAGLLRLEVEEGHAPRITRAGDAVSVQKLEQGAVPALLGHLEGALHWHASAVAYPEGRAVVFMADAGTGKSTLAAALCARGAQFLGDDIVQIRPEQNAPPRCLRRETRHALRPDMAALLYGAEHFGKAVFDADALGTEAPLGAIVQLRTGTTPSLQALGARDRVALLLRHLVRFALDDEVRLRRDLDVCVAIGEAVPMYNLVVPRHLDLRAEPLHTLLGTELHGVLCPRA